MIVGLGTDLCDIRRIEKTLDRFGDRFLERVFTPLERAKAMRCVNPAWTLAKRFAAKEACAKALGTGFRKGVFWRDMGVVNLPTGRPTIEFTNGAKDRLLSLITEGYDPVVHLALTDEFPIAEAQVIISLAPKGLVLPNPDAT